MGVHPCGERGNDDDDGERPSPEWMRTCLGLGIGSGLRVGDWPRKKMTAFGMA
jgi:hypothetical protein